MGERYRLSDIRHRSLTGNLVSMHIISDISHLERPILFLPPALPLVSVNSLSQLVSLLRVPLQSYSGAATSLVIQLLQCYARIMLQLPNVIVALETYRQSYVLSYISSYIIDEIMLVKNC